MSKKTEAVNLAAHPLPHPEMTVGQAALALLKREGNRFMALSKQATTSQNPEVVHDMRVACRRIRVALKDFSPFLPGWLLPLDKDFKAIFKRLGAVRDCDVQLKMLKDLCPDSEARDELAGAVQCERSKAVEGLRQGLAHERFANLSHELERLGSLDPDSLSEVAEMPLASVGREIIRKRVREVASLSDKVDSKAKTQDVHDFRKAAKRLRYSLETVASVYGRPAERVLKRLKRLQDEVGSFIDAEIAVAHLRQLLKTAALTNDARKLARRLMRLHCQTAKARLQELDHPWDCIQTKRWPELRRRMKEERRKAFPSTDRFLSRRLAPQHAAVTL